MKKLFLLVLLFASSAQAWLITPQPSGSPSPAPSISVAHLQQLEAMKIRMTVNQDFKQLTRDTTMMFNEIWNNPKGLTPQQVFTALGTDAGALHAFYLNEVSFLNSVVAGTITLTEPHSVTVNSDGTITVGP
jgi:hypothetical protein